MFTHRSDARIFFGFCDFSRNFLHKKIYANNQRENVGRQFGITRAHTIQFKARRWMSMMMLIGNMVTNTNDHTVLIINKVKSGFFPSFSSVVVVPKKKKKQSRYHQRSEWTEFDGKKRVLLSLLKPTEHKIQRVNAFDRSFHLDFERNTSIKVAKEANTLPRVSICEL